jgi:dGTPase
MGDVGQRFLTGHRPSLEAQVANLADEIAYNNHDVDDGLRSGLLSLEQLAEVRLFASHLEEVRQTWPHLAERRVIHETVRRMINTLVTDMISETLANIAKNAPRTLEEVRCAPGLAAFSTQVHELNRELKSFLRTELYRHYRVMRMSAKARRVIRELFHAFMDDPRLLPPQSVSQQTEDLPRTVADYIAGMTDRYAIREHRRIFAIEEI